MAKLPQTITIGTMKNYIPRWITDPYGFFRCVLIPVLGFAGVAVPIACGAFYWTTSTTCRAMGEAMRINVYWNAWTGCMISVKGQLLPWSEVVPIERNGKIEFVPKPVIRLQSNDN